LVALGFGIGRADGVLAARVLDARPGGVTTGTAETRVDDGLAVAGLDAAARETAGLDVDGAETAGLTAPADGAGPVELEIAAAEPAVLAGTDVFGAIGGVAAGCALDVQAADRPTTAMAPDISAARRR
jgi:hypothetical protein